MLAPQFVILGALINLAGGIGYVISTLKGRTQPNRVSWLLWTLAPFIAFAAERHEGVGLQALFTFIVGFDPLLVFIASFVNKRAQWKLTTFDFACGGLSLIGLGLWLITRHGDMAIFFSILADGLAALPTIRKSWNQPHSENWLAYGGAAGGAALTLLTIDDWSFANYGFPVYILAICGVLVYLIRFRPHKVSTV